MTTSSAPPWSESTTSGSEMASWGRNAVNGTVASGPNTPRIYMIDSGVGFHTDLTNVTRKGRADIASWLQPGDAGYSTSGISLVGCNPHATHVAGILGAPANGFGVAGVIAGAPVVSINVSDRHGLNGTTTVCSESSGRDGTASLTLAAMDWIKNDIQQDLRGLPGIVNISMNGDMYSDAGGDFEAFDNWFMRPKLRALATREGSYQGAFIAQSAGNAAQDSCGVPAFPPIHPVSYGPISPNDGIMVVGAVDDTGQRALGWPGANGPYANSDGGSNFGACIDIWAPGVNILSTWASESQTQPVPQQEQGTTYSGRVRLSGTSMAAPHVAGVAAAILQAHPMFTPAQIEGAIRYWQRPISGSNNGAGQLVNVVSRPGARLANVSTRGNVFTGNDIMIGGFVVQGASAKNIIVRARGPSLSGIANTLSNPVLIIWGDPNVFPGPPAGLVAANDDWATHPSSASVQGAGFAPSDSREAAIYVPNLPPGGYTAHVYGAGGATGVGIFEVWEMDAPATPFANMSTRANVGTGDNVLIAGFIISGDGPMTILVRGEGPSLNVPNAPQIRRWSCIQEPEHSLV